MAVFDMLLDELAKEIKEAPGWVSLVVVCNLLLLLPSVNRSAQSLGIPIGEEQGTVATLIAIVLFFLGDALDTLVFPRDKDAPRAEKALRSVMLSLAAWGLFLFIRRVWEYDACIWAVWAFLFPLHDTLARSRKKSAAGKDGQKGLAWLAPSDLKDWRQKAEGKLSLSSGVYGVSKGLAKAAGEYDLSRIQFQNESAKFIRSVVLPTAAVGGLLLYQGHWIRAASTFLAAFALVALYGRLKAWHIRGLYKLAVDRDKTSYSETNLDNGPRVFCWNGQLAGSGKPLVKIAA